jgi:predicted phosphate transport protein (TIGR00153 family)
VLEWFRRLVPQAGDFFGLFERHSQATVAAAEALLRLVRGEGERASLIAEIRDREHQADELIREVLHEVRQTFLTPFDRGAIIGLIGAMDDVIDELQACASAVETYEFASFEPDMEVMAEKILAAVRLIDEALPLLREISRHGEKLHRLTAAIVTLEGEVDVVHTRGLMANYARAREDGDTIRFIVEREIFKHLEKVADAFEDVANQIDGIVIDYA